MTRFKSNDVRKLIAKENGGNQNQRNNVQTAA